MPFTPSPLNTDVDMLMLNHKESRKSYFWTDDEHFKFVANFHTFGRSWKLISQIQSGRDPLQCRTHGQKYLMSLQHLGKEIAKVLKGEANPQNTFCQKISRYEHERR
jgi:hypothetical protein